MNEGDSSLLCPVCKSDVYEISFSDRSLLHRHIQEEHGYVQCGICPVTVFVAPDSRDQHNSKHHPGAKLGALKRKPEPAEDARSRKKLARLEEEDDSPDVDLNSLIRGGELSKSVIWNFDVSVTKMSKPCEEEKCADAEHYGDVLVSISTKKKKEWYIKGLLYPCL